MDIDICRYFLFLRSPMHSSTGERKKEDEDEFSCISSSPFIMRKTKKRKSFACRPCIVVVIVVATTMYVCVCVFSFFISIAALACALMVMVCTGMLFSVVVVLCLSFFRFD